MAEKILIDQQELEKLLEDLSVKILNDVKDLDLFAIVGVQTRGVYIARRLKALIDKKSGKDIKFGILDITFYRDDLGCRNRLPVIKETRIDFEISNKTLLLVDDVLYTGRTVKAALETLTTFGRPGVIKLFSLVDRGNRELPIQPDYCGLRVVTSHDDLIKVMLKEKDGEDKILLTGK